MSITAKHLESKNATHPTLFVIVIFAFFSYSFLAYGLPRKFDSPDETANYRFSLAMARDGNLVFDSPRTVQNGLIHPRSTVAADGQLLPGSFLGLPFLFGLIGRGLGTWVIPFLTPFASAIGLAAFFALARRIVNSRTAFLATFLLAIHPAFWYWSSRGLFHNALFLDMVIFGLLFLVRALERSSTQPAISRIIQYGLSGLFLGLAAFIRTSEIIWIAIVVFIILAVRRRALDMRLGFWVLLAAGALPLALMLFLNSQLYGQPLISAYTREAITTATTLGVTLGIFEKLSPLFFPFGVEWRTIAVNVWEYGLKLFWLPSLLAVFGFFSWWRSRPIRGQKLFLALTAVVTIWLVLYYGSWTIQDNPDPQAVTIGTSYTRYWLPLYAASTIFAASFLLSVYDRWNAQQPHSKKKMRFLTSTALLVMFLVSTSQVIFDPLEGLAEVRKQTVQYQDLADRAVVTTPENAVIIAGRGDKIFFSERSVIYAVDSSDDRRELRRLMNFIPTYLFLPAGSSLNAMKKQWEGNGFLLGDALELSDEDRLFPLHQAPER